MLYHAGNSIRAPILRSTRFFMELQQYLRIVRRHWRSVIATLLLCVVVAAAATMAQKPTYTSSSALFLAVESGDSAGELSQGASYAGQQVKTFVAVAVPPQCFSQ